jgi:hypothetical protein
MIPTIITTPRVEPTDAAIIVEVETTELSGAGYPASTAAVIAIRSYKQTGVNGTVLDMTHLTSLLFVSQLKTFWEYVVVSQSGSHAPHWQSHPSLEP